MTDISKWDINASNNTEAAPNGFPELMAPGGVNNSAREMMAAVARARKDTAGGLVSTGTGNSYRLATNESFSRLSDINELVFSANFSNTSSATLKVNNLALKPIVKDGGATLSSGDIGRNQLVSVRFNANQDKFVITSPLGNASFNSSGSVSNSNTLGGLSHTADDRTNSIVSRDGAGRTELKKLNLTNLQTASLDSNDYVLILDNDEVKKTPRANFLSWIAAGILTAATAWTPSNTYYSPDAAQAAALAMVPSNALAGKSIVMSYQKTSSSRSWQARASYIIFS